MIIRKRLFSNQINWAAKSLLVLICVLLGACGGSQNVINTAPPVEDYVAPEYKIGVGDSLAVNVWKNLEVSGPALVRPDGRISIALIGDVIAVGQTTAQLSKKIADKLTAYIRLPQVSVVVTQPANADFNSLVRITGSVAAPTAVPYQIGMTVMDLVLAGGGTTEFAKANKSLLYRKDSEGDTKVYALRLGDIFRKGDLKTNYELRPSDVIVVPERAF